MKVTKMSVVDTNELERDVELQFGLDHDTIHILDLFGDMCENDSYQILNFADSDLEEAQEDYDDAERRNHNIDLFRYRLLVLTYLHDVFPDEDKVLWLCAW